MNNDIASISEEHTKKRFSKRNREGLVVRTLHLRIKDKHAKTLNKMAFEVNQVWNACNDFGNSEPIPGFGWYVPKLNRVNCREPAERVVKERSLSLHSQTVQMISNEHRLRRDKALHRKEKPKSKLRWRVSSGSKRSLGWIPFCGQAVKFVDGKVRFNKNFFDLWDSFGLDKYELRDGSFAEDSQGKWYFNVSVEIPIDNGEGGNEIGIDLGLKNAANFSDGKKLKKGDWYRKLQKKIGMAQRANKKKRVKALHAKAKNQRKDYLHKASTKLVQSSALIVCGDISSKAQVKTKNAKSVLDSGWGIFRTQLEYKAIGRRVVYMQVSERYSTQLCSCCKEIPGSSPKGRSQLRIREWTCDLCGTTHDRDRNAAQNILNTGKTILAAGHTSKEDSGNVKIAA